MRCYRGPARRFLVAIRTNAHGIELMLKKPRSSSACFCPWAFIIRRRSNTSGIRIHSLASDNTRTPAAASIQSAGAPLQPMVNSSSRIGTGTRTRKRTHQATRADDGTEEDEGRENKAVEDEAAENLIGVIRSSDAKRAKKAPEKESFLGVSPTNYGSRCPDPKEVTFDFLNTDLIRTPRLVLPNSENATYLAGIRRTLCPAYFGLSICGKPLRITLTSILCCRELTKKCLFAQAINAYGIEPMPRRSRSL
ncbi:hypothetical protein MMC29_008058 [Sticta canariensis]|nr:hypothetical protein [Sticta canariensis]